MGVIADPLEPGTFGDEVLVAQGRREIAAAGREQNRQTLAETVVGTPAHVGRGRGEDHRPERVGIAVEVGEDDPRSEAVGERVERGVRSAGLVE